MRLRWMRFYVRYLVVVFGGGFLLYFYRSGISLQGENDHRDSQELKEEILILSKKYITKLVNEQQSMSDHRFAASNTNYDLKKTLAVLLESILSRLDSLEAALALRNSGNWNNSDPVSVADLLNGVQEVCPLPSNWRTSFPDCEGKLKWMETFWKSDPCYSSYGVDGSACSFIIYLSEVEQWCPQLAWRPVKNHSSNAVEMAQPQTELAPLFELMNDNPTNFEWIKQRILRMWPSWVSALRSLVRKQKWTLTKRRKNKIILHLGFLTKESGFKFGEKSLKGGPLGELVQWSDLIACLYILGHDIEISSEINTFVNFAQADPALKSSCPVLEEAHVHLIYTDIVGLRQMRKKIPASLQNYKCRLRVLDSFGTHAEFNYQPYFAKHKEELGGKNKNVWGGHDLNLKQFYNMFPHTPDNSFLGFVVENYLNETELQQGNFSKKPWALVYGKELYMWSDMEPYLRVINEFVEIHATVNADSGLPSFVKNHGVLSGKELHALLRQSKLFIGLGFPYEGPAPLEAIANGAVVINPKFSIPKGRRTNTFFNEKPTLRELTSQNPYVEDFIGYPHVFTIDISNLTLVRETVRAALEVEVSPYLPYEFTAEGMLQRLNAFVKYQGFCDQAKLWPPFSPKTAHVLLAAAGKSCKDACWDEGFVCEPGFFKRINELHTLNKYSSGDFHCAQATDVEETHAPSFSVESNACFTQSNVQLFSCASQSKSFRRLCACRDFIKDQTALCAGCL